MRGMLLGLYRSVRRKRRKDVISIRYKKKFVRMFLISILVLCIPLQVYAGRSLSDKVNDKTDKKPSVHEQLDHKKEQINDAEEKLADPDSSVNVTPEQKEQATQILNGLQQIVDGIQDILNIDQITQEATKGSTSTATADQGTHSSAVAGFIGGTSGSEAVTMRIGLAKLDNESFSLVTDFNSYDEAVQNYGSKYYVACEGGAMYYPSNKGCNTTNRGKLAVNSSNSEIAHSILQCMYNNTTGPYVKERALSGTKYIDLTQDELEELMLDLSSIDSRNKALYQEWKNGSDSSNPIVAVIEVAGLTINGKHVRDSKNHAWVSVADCAYEIGDASAYEAFLSTNLTAYANTSVRSENQAGKVASNSDAAIMAICGYPNGLPGNNGAHNWWPYFYTKHMFGTWWPTGGVADHTVLGGAKAQTNSTAWSSWAYKLKQTKSTGPGIHGCTMFALRPSASTGMQGTFDWHIDAEGLPLNATGHAEDAVVNDTSGSSTKHCTVGSVSLYNENWQEWAWYIDEQNISTVNLQVETYSRGQNTFTTDAALIKGTPTDEGIVSTNRVLEKEITLTAQDFINKLKSRDVAFEVVSNDVLGVKEYDLRVAYAMTIDVVMGGETFSLVNDDVHWAVYGSEEGRTFKFQQVAGDGYAQIKQGDLDAETFEAMAGTPTTEDLFITMGGEQYVVNMQFRYVVDDYIRTYQCDVPATPNLTYYKIDDASSEASDSDSGTTENDDESYTFNPDPITAYNNACTRDFSDARDAIRTKLSNLGIDTNNGAYSKYYTKCVTNSANVLAGFSSFLDGLSVESESSDSSEITLFEGTDPDTGEQFKVTAYLKFSTTRAAPNPTSSATGGYQGWLDSEPSADNYLDPADYMQAHSEWASAEPSPKYRHHYEWSESYGFELIYNYYGDSTLSRECRHNSKQLSDSITIEQVFKNVKYMDILDCHVWQLAEGREVGIGEILAVPISTKEEVLKIAIEQMGYVYYDSEQAQERDWDSGKLQWRCVDATDLEATGRLVNSYNSGMPEIKEGSYFNGDKHAFKVTGLGDTMTFEYSLAEQGGRSSRSMYKFIAQAAAHTFYKNPSEPYTNTILCSSDTLALYAGDRSASDWLSFCAFEFNTADYTGIENLEQYILKPEGELTGYVTTNFTIDGRNSDASQGTAVKPIFTTSCVYRNGTVTLDNAQAYKDYNRETICITNPYTFVNTINESKDMPRVGYKGDWLTSHTSHAPVGYTKNQEFEPYGCSVFNGVMDGYRAGVTGFARNNVLELAGPVEYAYPHMTGLNVNRSQINDTYATGYAGLCYRKIIDRECTRVNGVMSVCMYNNYVTAGDSALVDTSTFPKGMFLRADYDDSWDTVNDIVIFNPSTAENTYVYNMSQYLPDAQNTAGTEYESNPLRDQRVTGYYVGGESAENVMVGSGEVSSEISDLIESVDYKLKGLSDMATTYYTGSDYVSTESSQVRSINVAEGDILNVTVSASYTLTLFDSHAHSTTVKTYLEAGDTLYNSGSAVYLKARPEMITFADLLESERLDANTPLIKLLQGASVHYDLSGLGALKRGEVIHVSLQLGEKFGLGSAPFSVYVNDEEINQSAMKYITSQDGRRWDYYIELNQNTTISDLSVVAEEPLSIMKMAGDDPMVKFEDSYLMDVGGVYTDPAIVAGTLEHDYITNSPAYVGGSHARAYNELRADYSSYSGLEAGMQVVGNLHASYKLTSMIYALRSSALYNVHKVWNSNWRYYVIGWKTTNGNVISSPDDPLLNVDTTKLAWPSGNGYITVADLKRSACLVKYNGQIYLTTLEQGMNHYIAQLGSTVTSYDTFCLGNATSTVTISDDSATYPLQSGMGGQVWQDNRYEFFFRLTDRNDYLYDVAYATNAAYRFSPSDKGYDYNLSKANWEYDWEAVVTKIQTNVSAIDNQGLSHYISLDDEFSVHYDNLGNYAQTNAHNIGQISTQLGMGWHDNMDTSKWIYQKWVQFDIDVFMFDVNDPSVSYEDRTGLYFVPAGSLIPLGYYEGDNGEADNEGHWVDYGKDNDYNYHFWAALSTGEVREADMCFATLNINSVGANANTGNNEPNNKNAPAPPYRYENARRHFYTDIVGRIGGLTMIDTGDFRWSNTFKTVEDNADWLIHGLIRRISRYSNVFGVPSTQKTIVTDPFDVRGRIGMSSLINTDNPYSIYSYKAGTMNTYGTQWHKESDKVAIKPLPLQASYNDTGALSMTEQKVGYQSLMTLETIGAYYGNSLDESNDGVDPVNLNDDHGDQKIQVRSVYIALTFDDHGNLTNSRTVDVYMKDGATYKKINSGSTDVGTVLKSLYSNIYLTYMTTNTGSYEELDQNLMRRMVTEDEAAITRNLLTKYDTDTMSLVTPTKDNSLTADLSPTYTYGNGQYLFLRERNRNFVGKGSQALNGEDVQELADYEVSYDKYNMNAQKYYFDIGLPSSAIFVEVDGAPSTDRVSYENTFILTALEVYARGEVWMLSYKSPISGMDIRINEETKVLTPDDWNPIRDTNQWLIPVTFYDLEEGSSKDDLNTSGTH